MEGRVPADQAPVALEVAAVELVEEGDLPFLLRVGAHHARAREVLLHPRRELGEDLLHALEEHVDLVAEDLGHHRDERQRGERRERHAGVDVEQ